MKTILAILILSVNTVAQAQILTNAGYTTANKGYGGYSIYSLGGKYGGMYNDSSNAWCLGYSANKDMSAPSCMLLWNTSGITVTGTMAQTGDQTITGALSVSGLGTFGTLTTGIGATELYLMDQNVRTSDSVTFVSGTFTGGVNAITGTFTGNISAVSATFTGNLVSANINTGIGSTEVYLMDQNIRTSDSVSFVSGTFSGAISAVTATFSGPLTATTVNTGQGASELYLMDQNVRTSDSPAWAGATFTGAIKLLSASLSGLLATTPTAAGYIAFCSDCVPPKVVVSTGSIMGNWADAVGAVFK